MNALNGYFSFLYKMLRSTCEIVFHCMKKIVFHLLDEILQLVHEISSFPDTLYKRAVLKKFFSKFPDKLIKAATTGVLQKRCSYKFCKRHVPGVSF